jgi:hypothetical protein
MTQRDRDRLGLQPENGKLLLPTDMTKVGVARFIETLKTMSVRHPSLFENQKALQMEMLTCAGESSHANELPATGY